MQNQANLKCIIPKCGKEYPISSTSIKCECGNLLANGVRVHEDSPFYGLCADIYLEPKPNQVIPHAHEINPE